MGRNFPLAGLLRLRELQESKAAGELATANNALRGGHTSIRKVQEAAGNTVQYPVDGATMLAVAAPGPPPVRCSWNSRPWLLR